MTAAFALVREVFPLNNVGKPDEGVPPGPVAGGLVTPPSSTVVHSGLPPQPGRTASVTSEPKSVQAPIVFGIVTAHLPLSSANATMRRERRPIRAWGAGVSSRTTAEPFGFRAHLS